jgi:hypothetical protein
VNPGRGFSGAVSVTNNGISTIPSFTLGKPAVTFDLGLGRKKLRFEPQLRFALAGKPWVFLFWWRYPVAAGKRFKVGVGAHPAISFATSSVIRSGVEEDALIARRFLAGEITTDYVLTKHLGVGTHYLYSHGLERTSFQNMHFVSLTSRLSSADLAGAWTLSLGPQLYYLRMDDDDGFYATGRLAIARHNVPISFSAIVNKTLQTEIEGENFLWSLSLTYSY